MAGLSVLPAKTSGLAWQLQWKPIPLFSEELCMGVSENDWSRLTEAAMAASERAYCPYSKFRVGAALLTGDGRIFTGCNVENASYGLTICAERNTIFHAVAEGLIAVKCLLVYTPTEKPAAPCGACRQVLNEFGPDAQIRCICDGSEVIDLKVSDLLPKAFGPANLSE
jgi:cytidine deaminase